MHTHELQNLKHGHKFHLEHSRASERRTHAVIVLTLTMMILEIVGGRIFGSMALLADGWHMGTHAAALGITAFAYFYARRHADNPDFSFGTGKVSVLGGFTSAVVLALIAILMLYESSERLLNPVPIKFNEAIFVACLGLIVNLVSAYLLMGRGHDHHRHDDENAHHHRHDDENNHHRHRDQRNHDHRPDDDPDRHHDYDYPNHHRHRDNLDYHEDHNLRAAYFHVLADALTSFLAIIALVTGKAFGWIWMDPFMGIVGSLIIARWSYGLLRDTSKILLDREAHSETIAAMKEKIESDGHNQVSDIHLWRIGSYNYAAEVTILTHHPEAPEYYKSLLSEFTQISHLTVEVHAFDEPCCICEVGETQSKTEPGQSLPHTMGIERRVS